MSDPAISTALGAVRRHLWRERARVAVRRAAWACAASMLLAAVVHLVVLPLPTGTLLLAIGVPWIAMLAWAAWRRPNEPTCAWWIDRHLGGATAFTTWLDATSRPTTPENAQAVLWLDQWTATKVPEVLRSLGQQRPTVRLSRSLLSMVVCSLLSILVLSLPREAAPSERATNPAAVSAVPGDKAIAAVDAPATAQVASEISSALRPPESQGEPDRRGTPDAPATGPTRSDDSSGSPPAPSANAAAPDGATARDARPNPSVEAPPTSGQGRSADAPGRDAGASPDTRGDTGASPVPRGTMPAQRTVPRPTSASVERQADMDQAGAFDEKPSPSGRPTSGAFPGAAAATPPPATDTARMTPTETSYVQAWMRATGPSR